MLRLNSSPYRWRLTKDLRDEKAYESLASPATSHPAGTPGPIAFPGAPELLIHPPTLLGIHCREDAAHTTVCVMADTAWVCPTAGETVASGLPPTATSRGIL
jgi:hypothetical protein